MNAITDPFSAHQDWFDRFVQEKISQCAIDQDPLRLKLDHTHQVLANSCEIAKQENFDPKLARICALAALYHDLARFDQYLQYGTFKDTISRNHGLWGVTLLKHHNRLMEEDRDTRHIIYTAIGLHNRATLPKDLAGTALTVTHVVRDSDKLDILRVMDQHLSRPGPYNPTIILSLPDKPKLASKNVLAAALKHQTAFYNDLTSVNDFRILLGTWYFDLNFAASRRIFRNNGHAQKLVSAITADGPHAVARAELLRCFTH